VRELQRFVGLFGEPVYEKNDQAELFFWIARPCQRSAANHSALGRFTGLDPSAEIDAPDELVRDRLKRIGVQDAGQLLYVPVEGVVFRGSKIADDVLDLPEDRPVDWLVRHFAGLARETRRGCARQYVRFVLLLQFRSHIRDHGTVGIIRDLPVDREFHVRDRAFDAALVHRVETQSRKFTVQRRRRVGKQFHLALELLETCYLENQCWAFTAWCRPTILPDSCARVRD
jgi:hypothetical protein